MDCDQNVQELRTRLQSDRVRVCREALESAEDLLVRGRCTEEVLALLEDVLRSHPYVTIKETAGTLSEKYRRDIKDKVSQTRDIPVECPNCKLTNWFTKAILCSDNYTVYRTPGGTPNTVRLYGKCTRCDFDFSSTTIDITCGGANEVQ